MAGARAHPVRSGAAVPPVPSVSSGSAPAGNTELMPGDVVLGLAGDGLRTLLGSCVAVVLTDPRRTVGAMCHIVHVGTPNPANAHNTAYGAVAMRAMFERLHGVGIAAQRCHAFVYGGGNMFPALVSGPQVGQRNVHWALEFLAGHGIAVLDQCVGGCSYRRVWWRVGPDLPRVDNVSMEQGGFL